MKGREEGKLKEGDEEESRRRVYALSLYSSSFIWMNFRFMASAVLFSTFVSSRIPYYVCFAAVECAVY